ncbi:hypothetical protein KY284_030149 [Solanum tuberosum]|nr:hypothetical protein KY284_030149 [Solanum tuberosum]
MHTNNFSILIEHNGRWDSLGNYVDYNIEGVMYDPTTKYEGLITTMSSQLGVDTTIYHLELRYFVSGPSPPMKIHNDTGVQKDQVLPALDASIRGWEYCRPIVVVDGSTLDPGGVLPLAYGIVDSENDDSWLWFFENFKNAFGEREDMCFVSDRNKSIWNATAAVYPEFRHYACVYHLWTNLLKKTYRDTEEVPASTIHLHNITDGAKRFTVCLNTRMCSCARFQHDEIPCSHALAAIRHRNKLRDDYCLAYYSNKNYQDTYAIPMNPCLAKALGMFHHMSWKR